MLVLGWIPGHRSILGNVHNDTLAKEIVLTPFLGLKPACGVGWSMVKARVFQLGLGGTEDLSR